MDVAGDINVELAGETGCEFLWVIAENGEGVEASLYQTGIRDQVVKASAGDLGCSSGGTLERLVVLEIALNEVDVASVPRGDLGFAGGYVADKADDDVVGVAGDVVEEGEADSSGCSGDEVGRHVGLLVKIVRIEVS